MAESLKSHYLRKFQKSLRHLEYSVQETAKLSTVPGDLSEAELAAWDSLSVRFARSSDIFLSKVIKAAVQDDDPGFDGSFRDYLNRAEKLGLIQRTDIWLEIRELRNVVVHDYTERDLQSYFEKLRQFSPLLLELEKILFHAP